MDFPEGAPTNYWGNSSNMFAFLVMGTNRALRGFYSGVGSTVTLADLVSTSNALRTASIAMTNDEAIVATAALNAASNSVRTAAISMTNAASLALIASRVASLSGSSTGLTAYGFTLVSNYNARLLSQVAAATVTNWTFDFAHRRQLWSKTNISSEIVVAHSTNLPPAGQTGELKIWVETGVTNRFWRPSAQLSGHCLGVVTNVTAILLESNSTYQVAVESRNGATNGVYWNYPIKTFAE